MSDENNNFLNDDQTDNRREPTSETVSFDDSVTDYSAEGYNYHSKESKEGRNKKRHVTWKTLAISIITVMVATLMLTYWICSSVYQSMYAQAYVDANKNTVINNANFSKLDLLSQIVNAYSYEDLNHDEMMEAAMKSYIESSGDVYATYYTKEELQAATSGSSETDGKMTGIGINIINDIINYNGEDLFVIRIVNVMKDSPAREVGIKSGDLIYAVEINGEMKLVDDVGFSVAIEKMAGAAGTKAKLSILRKSGDSYEKKTFEAVRREVITTSVIEKVYSKNSEIGVIWISTFDNNTPAQFENAIESLKTLGCKKFVIDLRDNSSDSFASVEKMLSYFLNSGDIFMQNKNNQGKITSYKLTQNSIFADKDTPCSIKEGDIGKYRDLDVVILCNKSTARLGELFVSAFKDYQLAPIVGVNTYGDSLLQRTYYLGDFLAGSDGAVTLSTDEMLSPKGNSFYKNGVTVDADKTVSINKEAETLSIYELSDDLDNQLQKAVEFLK